MIVATDSVIPIPPVAGLPTVLPPPCPPPAPAGAAPFGDRTGGSDFPTVATANRTARVATTAAAAARARWLMTLRLDQTHPPGVATRPARGASDCSQK